MVLATFLITLNTSLRAQTYTVSTAGTGQTNNFPQPQFAGRVVVADFDGDGDADILTQTGGNGSPLTYSRCGANATFTTVPLNDPTSPFRDVAAGFPNLTAFNDYAADFDHDGDQDLWLTTNNGTGFYFRNDGGVFVSVSTAGLFPSIGSQLRVTIADFTGDGFPDILFQEGFPTAGAYHYFKNNGVQGAGLGFTEIALASSPFAGLTFPTHQGANVFTADFDKDGDIDIWFGGDIDDPVVANRNGWFFKNNGTSFAAASNSVFPILNDIGDATIGDFDSDGDIDILYQNGGNGQPYNVALNTSTGGNVSFNIIATTASIFGSSAFYDDNTFVVADFDGDTDMDIWQPRANTDGRFFQQVAEPPYIISSTPADNAVNVDPTGNITITFNKAVNKGTGNFRIVRTADNVTVQTIDVNSASVTTAGASPATTWTIDPPSNLAYGVGYSILSDPATFRLPAPSNIAYLGIDDIVTFNFTTRNNTAPTVANLNGDAVSYQEGTAAVVLDAGDNATVTDADSPDFIGGNITVTIDNNKGTGDKLGIGNIGLISVSGSNINYSGSLIGTFTGDGFAAPLVISFTSATVTPAVATSVIRAITFLNTSNNPSTSTRTVTFTVNDGDGGTSTVSSVSVAVTAVNTAPVNTVPSGYVFNEDTQLTLTGIQFSDPDQDGSVVSSDFFVPNGSGTFQTTGAGVTVGAYTDGTNTGITITGTYTALNTFMLGGNVKFTPTASFNGNTLSISVRNQDGGHTGTGGVLTDLDLIPLTINAINDAPVNNVPTSISVTEEVATALTGISFSDVDAGSAPVKVTLSVPSGTLAAATGSGVTVGGTATALTLTGSITDINAFIAASNVTFLTTVGSDVTMTVLITDQGNTGAGGPQTDSDPVTLSVIAVNDAPALAIVTTARTAQEDVAAIINDIVISDEDAGAASIKLTLAASTGTITAGTIAGVTVTGNGTGTIVLTGTLTAINAGIAAGSLSYKTAQDDTEPVTITVTVDDQGNTGTGGAKTATATLNYSITAVNDAPVNTVPANIGVTEKQASVLTGISFSDVDAGSAVVLVTLSVPTGTLAATSGGGVTVGGTSTALTLTGSIADINAFIAASKVTFTTITAGNVILTVSINDNGNTGSGGSQTDTDQATLVVGEVNDAPVLTITPAALSGNEDNVTLVNNISIADEDIYSGIGLLELQSSSGTLSAATQAGITIVSGNNTNDVKISGTLANLNSYLLAGKVSFVPAPDFNGAVTITATFDDQGNTGSGGAKQDQQTFTINVSAINDAPSIAAVASISVDEDQETAISGISFADVDAGSGVVKATFAAVSGTLAATDGGGVTVAGSGTNTVVLTGTIAAINSFISAGSLKYTPVANATGNVSLSVNINDNGHSGADPGGPSPTSEEASTTVVLTLVAVNDAPVITGTAPIAVTEDVNKTISGMSLSDEDAGSESVGMTFTLPGATGTLAATSGSGVTVTGSNTAALSLAGTVTNINAFIAGNNITYLPASNLNGDVTLTLTATDNGHTGTGGALQAVPVQVILRIAAVNDVPSIASNPIPFSVQEDVPTAIRPLSFADVDAGTGIMKASFVVAAGAGTFNATSGNGVTVSNAGSNNLTLEGTLADINTFIAGGGVTYTTPLNSTVTPRAITVRIDDNGHTGSGGNLFAQLVINATVIAVNDAPEVTIPAAQSVDMNTSLVLSGADKISISDVDLNGGSLSITLTATNGVLTLGNTGGVTFTTGDGVGDATMTFSGTLSNVNAALNGLTYIPSANYYGAATIKVTADDQGNTGTGGVQTDEKTLQINVQPTFPIITAVSSTTGNGTYKLGDVIPVTVTFNMPVLVTGTPQLQLETGATDRHADYISGNNTNTLTFNYTVQSGDLSADLDYKATTALQLNGGTIKSVAGLNAALTLAAPGAAGSLGANKALVVDGVVPTITSVSVPVNGTYITGQVLQFTVNASEVITVNTTGGSPTLALQIGTTTVQAAYVPGAPATAIQFRYTVANGDLDTDGINVSGLQLNGATMQDAAGNNLDRTLQSVAPTTAVLVDAVAPAVTSVDIPANKLWKAGDVLNFVVHYSEAVTIAGGTPSIAVTIGSSVKNFTLSAGAGSNTLTFSYTVAAGDLDRDGIVGAGNISLNTATIKDAAGNNAALALNGMGATTGVLVDAVPPVITANQVFSINENSVAGTTVGAVDGNDPGSTGTLQQWTITTNVDPDGDGVPAFVMDPASNVIKVNDAGDLNYEANSSLTISVRVSDGVNQSAVQTVKINLNDMPEPPLDIQLSNLLIAENNVLNIIIGTFTATADEPGTTFTYSLVAGTGSNDNSSFSITGDKLAGLKVFNFEDQSSFRIRVRATTQHGEYLEKAFVIGITDVNEAPTLDAVTDKSYCASGNDERIAFTNVTAGPEAGQTVTLTATNDNNALFSSFAIAGNELRIRFVAGASGVATVTVTAKDNGGTANGGVDQVQRTFRIAVSSINVPVITSNKGLKVSKGDVVLLTAAGGVSYVWDPSDDIQGSRNQAVLVVRPKANATYRVTATNSAGCTASQTISIEVADDYKVDAVNILTPNGDGINDRFVIKNIDSYPNNELKIFDRVGRLIYNKRSYLNEWDGTLSGRPLQEGTYYYILDFGPGLPKVKGFITIIRDKY